MSTSIEQLLKPRYRVIADYPGSEWEVGRILTMPDEEFDTGFQEFLEKYPHLFKKLEWWEEREKAELPTYIKWGFNGEDGVEKVKYYKGMKSSDPIAMTYSKRNYDGSHYLGKWTLPATEAEYLEQINK